MVRKATNSDLNRFTKIKGVEYRFPTATIPTAEWTERSATIYTAEEDCLILGVHVWRGIVGLDAKNTEHQVVLTVRRPPFESGFVPIFESYQHRYWAEGDEGTAAHWVATSGPGSEDFIMHDLIHPILLEEDEPVYALIGMIQKSGGNMEALDVNITLILAEKP